MRFLFVHQNFPGQYRHIAAHYARAGHEVVAVGENKNLRRNDRIPGVRLLGYDAPTAGTGVQASLQRGRRVALGAAHLGRNGFVPDVIFAHIGWGEAVFLKEIFPSARLVLYCEYFYRSHGGDVGFESAATPERRLQVRVMNAPLLMALDASDIGMAPTRWQQSRFPAVYRRGIHVIHDGIDTDRITPGDRTTDELVTYVSRNLEPYRGFHAFMRAIPQIQRRRPKARVVVVGGDEVSYSPRLPGNETYRARMLAELAGHIDLSRVSFLGRIRYSDYLDLLRRSSVHVYLTYPFVLSWSMLEAMATGCLVVGSSTPPVQEVIRDGENGLLVDFFSPQAIAERVAYALEHQAELQPLRQRARQTVVARYDLKRVCLPAQLRMVDALQGQGADARPAADVKHLPGDKSRVAVGEEQHGARDVVGLA
jgi:glycosyltransferase involved in cell wall biosynthesis